MKNCQLLTFVLAFSSLGLFAQTAKKQIGKTTTISKKVNISGVVMQTSSYCGGAEMPPELLEEYSKPHPYGGKVFYIRKGKINSIKETVILSFTVNASGNFSLQLPPGIYSIIQEPQVKTLNLKEYQNNGFTTADADCLKKWWAQAYYVLEVKEVDINNLNFEFYHPCFVSRDIPCLHYDGPLPP